MAKQTFNRKVRKVLPCPLPDETFVFVSKSWTRDDETKHYCTVNPNTGFVFCTCPDFRYRKGSDKYHICSDQVCKHLARCIRRVREDIKKTVSTT